MSEKQFSLAESIKMAVDLEKNGRKFYLEAAEKTQNDSGKRIFKMLADEEALHLATFQTMMTQMEEVEDWKELVKGYPKARKIPVFDNLAPASKVTKARSDEMSALRIAMGQEQKAIEFFENVVKKTEDEIAQKVFQFVLEQEEVHYTLLQAEYDSIANTGFWFDIPEFSMDGKF